METRTRLKRHRDDVRMVAGTTAMCTWSTSPARSCRSSTRRYRRGSADGPSTSPRPGNTRIRNHHRAGRPRVRMSAMESVSGRVEAATGHIVRPRTRRNTIGGDRVVAMRTVENAMRPEAAAVRESAARRRSRWSASTGQAVAAFATTSTAVTRPEALISNGSTATPRRLRRGCAPRQRPGPRLGRGNVTTRSMGVGARSVKTVIEEVWSRWVSVGADTDRRRLAYARTANCRNATSVAMRASSDRSVSPANTARQGVRPVVRAVRRRRRADHTAETSATAWGSDHTGRSAIMRRISGQAGCSAAAEAVDVLRRTTMGAAPVDAKSCRR